MTLYDEFMSCEYNKPIPLDLAHRIADALRPRTEALPSGDGMSAGRFHCACVFSRPTDFSQAVLVEECSYHSTRSPRGALLDGDLAEQRKIHDQSLPQS